MIKNTHNSQKKKKIKNHIGHKYIKCLKYTKSLTVHTPLTVASPAVGSYMWMDP